ncbi:MAG: DUF6174 domain-containing protein [Chloroflexota bacterium]
MIFWRVNIIFGIVILGLIGLVACGAETAVVPTLSPQEATSQALTAAILASSEPPLNFDQLNQEINEAEALWTSQNLTTYRLAVSYREPNWNTQNLTLLIDDGAVIEEEHRCVPERDCNLLDVKIDDFEMYALFNIARRVVALEDSNTQITFNKRLGFPNAVVYSDATWIIQSVELVDK